MFMTVYAAPFNSHMVEVSKDNKFWGLCETNAVVTRGFWSIWEIAEC